MAKNRKNYFEKFLRNYMMVEETETLRLYGGVYQGHDGYYYLSQSELVDILGGISEIPSSYKKALVATSYNSDYTDVTFTQYYKLTQFEYHNLINRFQPSSDSFPSTHTGSSESSSSSSSSGGGQDPLEIPEKVSREIDSMAILVYDSLKYSSELKNMNISPANWAQIKRDIKILFQSVLLSAYFNKGVEDFYIKLEYSDPKEMEYLITGKNNYEKKLTFETKNYYHFVQ